MSTTDLQRLHQDEWLSALRMAHKKGRGSTAVIGEPLCVIGHAVAIGALDPSRYVAELGRWAGISSWFVTALWKINDGTGRSLSEIADWFKTERDAHDGDLSDWTPA